MIRYLMAAASLKLFSSCSPMKKGYRFVSRKIGTKHRTKRPLPDYYLDRAKVLLNFCQRHHAIEGGDRLLEIGTGWLHWESIIVRLFYDVGITLFDVCDVRQLGPLKRHFAELAGRIDGAIPIPLSRYDRVHGFLNAVATTGSFDDLYQLLGFQYVVDERGDLRNFTDGSFKMIYSGSVLEHIHRRILHGYIRDLYRLLEPGGYSIHTIDLGDHLSYYDKKASAKNYLRFSDGVWKYCFENEMQYFNRIQRSDWLELFRNEGFELIEEESLSDDIGPIQVNKLYKHLDRRDLECTVLRLFHRKPSLRKATGVPKPGEPTGRSFQ